jgi:hypothetical protein
LIFQASLDFSVFGMFCMKKAEQRTLFFDIVFHPKMYLSPERILEMEELIENIEHTFWMTTEFTKS